MASVTEMGQRIAGAGSLPELLDASHQAFEAVLEVLGEHDDPGGAYFIPAVMAGAWAASGRDHLCWAPSLPPGPLRAGMIDVPVGVSAPEAFAWVSGVCEKLAGCLGRSSRWAADPGDREACAGAAGCAGQIRLLTCAGPP